MATNIVDTRTATKATASRNFTSSKISVRNDAKRTSSQRHTYHSCHKTTRFVECVRYNRLDSSASQSSISWDRLCSYGRRKCLALSLDMMSSFTLSYSSFSCVATTRCSPFSYILIWSPHVFLFFEASPWRLVRRPCSITLLAGSSHLRLLASSPPHLECRQCTIDA